MELQLSEQQADLLQEILDQAFRDLRYEVAATDHQEYKHRLREREALLRTILDLVGGPLPNRR